MDLPLLLIYAGSFVFGCIAIVALVALGALPFRFIRATRSPVVASALGAAGMFGLVLRTNGTAHFEVGLGAYSVAFFLSVAFYARRDVKKGIPFHAGALNTIAGLLAWASGSVCGIAWCYAIIFGSRFADWSGIARLMLGLVALFVVAPLLSSMLIYPLVGLAALAGPRSTRQVRAAVGLAGALPARATNGSTKLDDLRRGPEVQL